MMRTTSIILLYILSSTVDMTVGFLPLSGSARLNNILSLQAGSNANEQIPLQPGCTTALITPFTSSGDIDVPCLEKLLDLHLREKTDNLCVLGTTAEAAVMSMEERALVLNTVVNKVKGQIPIMVGTGTINPKSVKDMTQQAIDLGADANLLVSPYYVKPPQRCLVKHFTLIADMGLPVIMYNVPGRTSIDVSDDTIALCAQHEYIVGLKDATGDVSRVTSLKQLMAQDEIYRQQKKDDDDDKFLLYSGDDGTTLDFCLAGGDGAISVVANLAPGIMHTMIQAALQGNEVLARQLNEPLQDLHKTLFIESNPIPTKWAAKYLGMINTSYCRQPLDELDQQYEDIVKQALFKANLIGIQQQ